MAVCLDFDNCIVATSGLLLNQARKVADREGLECAGKIKFEDLWHPHLEVVYPELDPFKAEILDYVFGPKLISRIPKIKDADETIHTLVREDEPYIVSARPGDLYQPTLDNLVNEGIYFPEVNQFGNFTTILTNLEGDYSTDPGKKIKICLERGITLLLDDYNPTVQAAVDAGLVGVVFDHPWNRELNEDNKKVFRVKSHKEFLQLYFRLKKEGKV